MKVSISLVLLASSLFAGEVSAGRRDRGRDHRALGKSKSSKKNHHHKPGYCNKTVYFLRADLAGSYRSWTPGTIKYGAEDCNAVNQCVGDYLVYEPIPVYSDKSVGNQVGTYASTQTMVSISDDHFVTLGNFAIEFQDAAKSELVFSGELDLDESGEGDGAGDFPILGGTGSYLGVTGEIDIHRDLDAPEFVDIKIVCL